MTDQRNYVAGIDHIVKADTRRLIDIFKDLHRNPELGFNEVRTARTAAQALSNLGFTVTTGIGRTGVVAVLSNGPGPVVMYRADMDALAVPEATGLTTPAATRHSDTCAATTRT